MTNGIKKYALGTRVDDNSYEVFAIWEFDLGHIVLKDRSERIDLALANNNISTVEATGMSNVAIGSSWDGIEFILPNPLPVGWSFSAGIPEMSGEGRRTVFCLLDGNTVFFIATSNENTPYAEMLDAAFAGDVSVFDISNDPSIIEGSIWNGTSWIS